MCYTKSYYCELSSGLFQVPLVIKHMLFTADWGGSESFPMQTFSFQHLFSKMSTYILALVCLLSSGWGDRAFCYAVEYYASTSGWWRSFIDYVFLSNRWYVFSFRAARHYRPQSDITNMLICIFKMHKESLCADLPLYVTIFFVHTSCSIHLLIFTVL